MCVPWLQLGEVREASQTYDKAAKQTGGDAPGLYKLMGQLARHSTVPGSGVSVENLESSLAPAESLPASKLDELEEAAAGVLARTCGYYDVCMKKPAAMLSRLVCNALTRCSNGLANSSAPSLFIHADREA